MAKHEQRGSKKSLPLIVFLVSLVIGGCWLWQSAEMANWKDRVLQYVDNRDIVTLEAQFTPEQIIEKNRKNLFGNDKKTLQNTLVKYYPYLLLDVKYPENSKTREGVLLWGLADGEMILNTDSWESTHGFRDCLECHAKTSDFKVIQTLARQPGGTPIENLQKELHVEREILDTWVKGAKQKGLILEKGNLLYLHFENPKILVTPHTKINRHLVSKPFGDAQKSPRNFSKNQIMEITQAAFGTDLKVRDEQEIFLPVFSFEILNPDGSLQISEWNALTGQPILPRYFSK